MIDYKINDDFKLLLDNFRQVTELYEHLGEYNKNTEKMVYLLDDETISLVCCEYLSYNLNQYFKKREIKGNIKND